MSTPRHSVFKRKRFADSSYLLLLFVLQNTRIEMPPAAAVKVICANGGNAHNKVSDLKRCCSPLQMHCSFIKLRHIHFANIYCVLYCSR